MSNNQNKWIIILLLIIVAVISPLYPADFGRYVRAQESVTSEGNQNPEAINPVVWHYGNGSSSFLSPHSVEVLPNGDLLIGEQGNSDVIILSRETEQVVWRFGEYGVEGNDDTHISWAIAAHQLKDGNIILTDINNSRVLVVDYKTKLPIWQYVLPDNGRPIDAIDWDDAHYLISDWDNYRVYKVNKFTKQIVWTWQNDTSVGYLTKLTTKEWNSNGGDLLVGTYDGVKEIKVGTNEVVWSYWLDADNPKWKFGEVYQRPYSAIKAVRYGRQEFAGDINWSDMFSALTFIVVEQDSKIIAVNYQKQTVWEYGGVINQRNNPSSIFCYPTYMSFNNKGNILVSVWGANQIIELDPWKVQPRAIKETMLLHEMPIRDEEYSEIDESSEVDKYSEVVEVRGYKQSNIMIKNQGSGIITTVQGSPDSYNWFDIETRRIASSANFIVDNPWSYLRVGLNTNDYSLVSIWCNSQR